MRLQSTAIPGCFRVASEVHEDTRGSLAKTFVASTFAKNGVAGPFREHFHSQSRRGVLRGMHVQSPPADGDKLVVCVFGEVLDVLVDLRVGSRAFGRPASFEMRGPIDSLLVPAGVAHGFYVLSDECILSYATTYEYVRESDGGVHWASVGFTWPDDHPIVSARDAKLQPLAAYQSPFVYGPVGEST